MHALWTESSPAQKATPENDQRSLKRPRPWSPKTPAKPAKTMRRTLKVSFDSLSRSLSLAGSLGHGVAGSVRLAHTRNSGPVALKRLTQHGTGRREAAALERAGGHRNVISLQCWGESDGPAPEVWLVLELWDHSLDEALLLQRFHEWQMKPLVLQLLSALAHCHQAGVLHRDIKPANLLLNTCNTSLVLADFSHAALLHRSEAVHVSHADRSTRTSQLELSSEMVTPLYRAPEVWAGEQYDEGVDIWAAGCVWAEGLLGSRLITPAGSAAMIEAQTRRVEAELSIKLMSWNPLAHPVLSHEGVQLLGNMLVVDPMRRCTADEALQNAYFGEEGKSTTMPELSDGCLVF